MKTIALVVVGIFIGWYGALAYAQPKDNRSVVQVQAKVYTDKKGAVIGYGNQTGNQTTFTDRNGKVWSYENRQGSTSIYSNPSGAYEGAQNRMDYGLRNFVPSTRTREED